MNPKEVFVVYNNKTDSIVSVHAARYLAMRSKEEFCKKLENPVHISIEPLTNAIESIVTDRIQQSYSMYD